MLLRNLEKILLWTNCAKRRLRVVPLEVRGVIESLLSSDSFRAYISQ